jgi:hypothetical protein
MPRSPVATVLWRQSNFPQHAPLFAPRSDATESPSPKRATRIEFQGALVCPLIGGYIELPCPCQSLLGSAYEGVCFLERSFPRIMRAEDGSTGRRQAMSRLFSFSRN